MNARKLLGIFLTILFLVGFILFVDYMIPHNYDWSSMNAYGSVIIEGFILTVFLSIAALFFSLIFGLILYFMKQSSFYTFRYIARVFTEVMFGSPLLVLVVILYYFVASAFGIDNKIIAAIIILTCYNSSYISEIYRGGIESIPKGQWQAAKVFGFTKYQTYRYIILPQVFRNILPPLTGQLALLIKSTALLSYMAVDEFFNTMMGVNANTFAYIEGYIVLAMGYLIITVPLSALIKYLEKRLKVVE
ncbi:amino acid ABC transporter permease [Vallitalea okinawensis]|uniref:amino acid ABC transporter permease n=1 Tax=Vallitalea okinawensis TaxID=2078660 RepID=UPI000CFD6564|nr:amino acid ABC transporter permease [Vallitalea okinawensis]